MTDIVEQVKEANPIEDVIEATGYPLGRKRGRYLRAREHDSLVIDVQEGAYFWNSKNESGDVITWLERRKGWDFKTAVEWLARRAKLPDPEWGREDNEQRVAARAKEDALTVAARVFVRRLRTAPAASAYVHGRGWTFETVQAAGLGFSGEGSKEEREELAGELRMHGVEAGSPGWRAVFKVPSGMLVYPHVRGGRVRYLSCRSIEGKRHWNLPVDLVGQRQVYCNHVYGLDRGRVALVEGQADAVSLGQWGIPAVALAGTAWQDHEGLLGEIRERYEVVYLGVDGDEAGSQALKGKDEDWPLGRLLGPMVRIIEWSRAAVEGTRINTDNTDQEEVESSKLKVEIKDANDVLKAWNGLGLDEAEQGQRVERLLATATPLVIVAARWAGGRQGAAQDRAFRTAFGLIARMDGVMIQKYRDQLTNVLGIGVREFNAILKEASAELEAGDEKEPIRVETLGGHFEGWLLEYLYDPEKDEAKLAFRDPDGKVGETEDVVIGDIRYVAKTPSALVRTNMVLFPSKVGNLRSTRELVAMVEAFINKYFLLDDRFFGRMAAYYVLLTWLYDAFYAIPYLRAVGDYGSGKSELMERIGHVCYRMMRTGGAGSAASLFRALEMYKGTAFMDEMDLDGGGDMTDDLVKILNLGAMRNRPVWRLDQIVNYDGSKTYEPAGYDVFGPKLITMRGKFKDHATESRCLTVKLMGKEVLELKAKGIPLHQSEVFYAEALALRNLLIRWRLEKWQPEIPVGEELMDLEVPARLNQVTMPLKAIAADDPELMADITRFVRSLNEDLILERGMGLDARVMEAVVEIFEGETEKFTAYQMEGELEGVGTAKYAALKHVANVTNELINQMNETADDDEEEEDGRRRRRRNEVTSRTVGTICRNTLQLKSTRRNIGYVVIYDPGKVRALKVKYGLATVEELMEIRGMNGRHSDQ